MTEEDKNIEKRKRTPLTDKEFLTFFFFPIMDRSRTSIGNYQLNDEEDERFIKYGYNKKLEQAKVARAYGRIFYIAIIIIIASVKILYF
ncbi:hypothetical protein [uncultured Psychroserpens sp.]|uniref:hypothetical protein n=1 Tax=uncultured Psychroserpens sp. TaxID=255436 RepID=UPI00260E42A1|nr:hypothetical protein [uncultured Psychroserpens sp.]